MTGNGERGASELVPVDPVEVGTNEVIFNDVGGIIPSLPVAEETNVLPETVTVVAPLLESTLTSGVGTTSVELLTVEFAKDGGMIPDAPVDEKVAVEPDVDTIRLPDDTVTFGGEPEAELAGGIIPESPVEVNTAEEPPMEMISMPEETETVMFSPGVCVGTTVLKMFEPGGGPTRVELVLGTAVDEVGGISPSEPVELL